MSKESEKTIYEQVFRPIFDEIFIEYDEPDKWKLNYGPWIWF